MDDGHPRSSRWSPSFGCFDAHVPSLRSLGFRSECSAFDARGKVVASSACEELSLQARCSVLPARCALEVIANQQIAPFLDAVLVHLYKAAS